MIKIMLSYYETVFYTSNSDLYKKNLKRKRKLYKLNEPTNHLTAVWAII